MPTLTWVGKDKVVNHHHDVPFRVLKTEQTFHAPKGAPANSTDNRIIHGDNLEALKSLLPEFEGKVKCIYIDPPYNTGNEGWVYNDAVNDPKIQKWLGDVVGKEGEDLSRHDKWLCMMYPRLVLLKKLLASDGVIFVSIGNDELHSLKLLLDEIFGRNNFIQNFIWETHGHTENQDEINEIHEYILCYSKSLTYKPEANFVVDRNVPEDSKILRDFAENSITKNGSKNPHSTVTLPINFPCEANELYIPISSQANELLQEADSLGFISKELSDKYDAVYPMRLDNMAVKDGKLCAECKVYSGWANYGKLCRFIENDCKPIEDDGSMLRFFLSKNGVIYYRREGRSQRYIPSVIRNYGTVEIARNEISKQGIKFPYPKPYELIAWLLSIFCSKTDIILDSFAGSGTTAQASLYLNTQDGGNRRFVLIEMMDYAKDTTAKRVFGIIKGYGEGTKRVEGLGGGFTYQTMGEPLFLPDDNLNEAVGVEAIRNYVTWTESIPTNEQTTSQNTHTPYLLGINPDTAWIFYYEAKNATCLDMDFLASIKFGGKTGVAKPGTVIIYADRCLLSKEFMTKHGIIFKKIPRDITRF